MTFMSMCWLLSNHQRRLGQSPKPHPLYTHTTTPSLCAQALIPSYTAAHALMPSSPNMEEPPRAHTHTQDPSTARQMIRLITSVPAAEVSYTHTHTHTHGLSFHIDRGCELGSIHITLHRRSLRQIKQAEPPTHTCRKAVAER